MSINYLLDKVFHISLVDEFEYTDDNYSGIDGDKNASTDNPSGEGNSTTEIPPSEDNSTNIVPYIPPDFDLNGSTIAENRTNPNGNRNFWRFQKKFF